MSNKNLPDFRDTERAFRHLSDRDLSRGRLLFELLSRPWLVAIGSFFARFALFIHLPIGWAIRPTVYAQFCGGENVDESEETIALLYTSKVMTILDYSAEGVDAENDLDFTCSEVLKTVEAAAHDPRHAFAVFKPSGLSSNSLLMKKKKDFSENDLAAWERVERRVRSICAATAEAGGRVLIDAEESWIQDNIDELAEDMMSDFNRETAIVFTTAQLYRHDRLAYIKDLTRKANEAGFIAGVKLVRGAYMEKERERAEERGYNSPIHTDKKSTDLDFDDAVKFCLENLERVHLFCGSHNEESNMNLCEAMADMGIANNDKRITFSQLLGMSDPITFNLADHGYNVAKYVPYGPIREAMPYLIRRAKENTSVAGQTSRELTLIREEIARRKS
ncbi:MAG: proline dehydrogenase family protein [Flavobacteriales bacterium]|nr:proline dehydrogenase family protein [Flavobacteriales bacterium]